MCSGRVDPHLILESFELGADGVFIGACLPGECHYSTGNFHAQARVEIIRKILASAGLNPERLVLRMMSSAEGGKFVQYAGEFVAHIEKLGAMGVGEKIDLSSAQLKLTAAKNAVAGKKLRWIMGKNLEFQEQGNLYGEIFTEHELRRLFEEVVLDECTIQEIMLRTRDEAQTVKRLSESMHLPASRVMRHLADMRRLGLVTLQAKNDTITWSALAQDSH